MTFHLFEDDASLASTHAGQRTTTAAASARGSAAVLHSIFSPPQKKSAAASATTNHLVPSNENAVPPPAAQMVAAPPARQPPPPPPPRQSFQQQLHSIRSGPSAASASNLAAAVPQVEKSVATISSVAGEGAAGGRSRPAPPPPPPRRQEIQPSVNIVAVAPSMAIANSGGGGALSSIPEVQVAPPPVAPQPVMANASTQAHRVVPQPPMHADAHAFPAPAQVVDATTSPAQPHQQMQTNTAAAIEPSASSYASPPKDIPRSLNIGTIPDNTTNNSHIHPNNCHPMSGIGMMKVATTPSANMKTKHAAAASGAGNGSPEGAALFMSPISVLTEATRQSLHVASSAFQHGTTSNAGNVPSAAVGASNGNAVPTLSVTRTVGNGSGNAGGNSSVVTYRNAIPIDMLDVGYVTKCTSIEELERIVDVLEGDEGAPKYPSLLRIAKSRLRTVRAEANAHNSKREVVQMEKEMQSQQKEHEVKDIVQTNDSAGNPILSRVRAESFHSAADPTPAAALMPAATRASAPSNNSTAAPSKKAAPLVISTGKRVNFAAVPPPLPSARSLDTPRSELAGFSLVDDVTHTPGAESGHDNDADTLNMDLTPSSYGGSVRSRLSRASSIRPLSSVRAGMSLGAGGIGSLTPIQNSPFGAAPDSTTIVDVAPAISPFSAAQSNSNDSATSSGDTDGTDNELKDNLASVLAEHSMLKSEIDAVVAERGQLQVRLASQTVELRDLQGRMARQETSFASKSKFLEDAKLRAESDLASLASRRVDSSGEARETMAQLKTKEREVLALQEEIRLVKEKRRKEFEASSELHDELLSEISYCTEELTAQKRRHAEALRALEERLNSEFEDVLAEQKNKVDILTENLYSSQVEVERLQKQKDELSRALKAVRTNVGQNTLSRVDRRKDVEEAVANATASEAAANAMAKALAISEKELIEAQEQQARVQRECRVLQEETSMLLQENRRLTERIQSLDEEICDSNRYTQTLLSQVNQLEAANQESSEAAFTTKQQLLSVERNYEAQVARLRSELNEKKGWVPNDLYKRAVRDLKKRDEEIVRLKNAKSKEKRSSKKKSERGILSPLALEIARESAAGKENFDVPRQVTVCRKAKGPRRVSPTNSKESKSPASAGENVSPNQTNTITVAVQGKLASKSLARMNAVRAAGGKQALMDKLKRARGQTPFTSPQ